MSRTPMLENRMYQRVPRRSVRQREFLDEIVRHFRAGIGADSMPLLMDAGLVSTACLLGKDPRKAAAEFVAWWQAHGERPRPSWLAFVSEDRAAPRVEYVERVVYRQPPGEYEPDPVEPGPGKRAA